jgi:hypothetical protein
MSRLAKLQLIGPALLLLAVAGAEAAALALAHAPGSQALWYIHLNLFAPLRLGDDLLGTSVEVAHGQLFLIAMPLFLLACGGFYCKRPLALAIASNLSLVHAAVLACAVYADRPAAIASLTGFAGMMAPRLGLCAGLLACALLSFSASHIIYLRGIYQEHG